MRVLRVLALSGLLALGLAAGGAQARDADPLLAAERAYGAVDFETQRAEALRALEAGDSDPGRLARIYRLLGIAHAALGEPERAKLAFMRLLALDSSVELEHVLSPRLRTPYMEARGYWDVTSTRLGVEVSREASSGSLGLTLHDPLGMVARVRVRSAGSEPQVLWEAGPEPRLRVPSAALAEYADVSLAVELLDSYANLLATRVVAALPARRVVNTPPEPPRAPEPPSLALPLVLAGSGLVALGIGATAHVARERSADEWNGSGCEQPGLGTRAQQCADVNGSRRSAEQVAIIAYGAGGVLLAGSVATYLLSSAHRREVPASPGLACGGGPTPLGLSCSTHF